jgi:hypothetical protein
MKITDTKPGELALWPNPHEVLDSTFVTEAYIAYGARPNVAKELSGQFFFALETLLIEKRELQRVRNERMEKLRQRKAQKD